MKTGMLLRAACGLALAMATSGAIAEDAAPIKTKTGEIGAAPAGKAQVVFFRPGSIMGMALGCTVHEGERELARLGAGKYYVVTMAPGKHTLFTRGQVGDSLNLEVEADETYFVKCKIGNGTISGAPVLEPSDRDSFAKKAKGSSMWTAPADWLQKNSG